MHDTGEATRECANGELDGLGDGQHAIVAIGKSDKAWSVSAFALTHGSPQMVRAIVIATIAQQTTMHRHRVKSAFVRLGCMVSFQKRFVFGTISGTIRVNVVDFVLRETVDRCQMD